MTLEPLLTASPAIQFHVVTVVPAALIGGVMLVARKGTFAHRMAGRVWIALMVLTALSTFLIHTIKLWGPFSPIHVLSVVTLISAFEIIRSARRRNFVRHQRMVKALYFGGIGIAGLFTLLPGRIMHEMVFAPVSAEAIQIAAPVATQAARGAPIWVWPLLAALIALGVSRMRDRDMPMWRLLLPSAILAGLSLLHVFTGEKSAPILAATLAGATAGLMAGWWSMRAVSVNRLSGNLIRVKGEYGSLVAILGIFAVRFAAGTIAATAPEIMTIAGVRELLAGLPVLLSSLMAARALAQAGYNPFWPVRQPLAGEAQY